MLEALFQPFEIGSSTPGFVTGYYEPEIRGTRTGSETFPYAIYRRPDDLITTLSDTERAGDRGKVTGFRQTEQGRVPYATRAEIDGGALEARGLEILYTDDPVDLFFLHVQGSGVVHMDDGTKLRLRYAGKNGHPYTSIARVLIGRGELSPDDIDMERVKAWLREDTDRGRALMQENKSYIFFSVEPYDGGLPGPFGAADAPLTPGRSLAVDPRYIPLGSLVFVSAPELMDENGKPFRRLMVAQDVGSAIQGPQRGDIFFGTGADAGALAGRTRHAAQFHVLKPKP